MRYLSLFSGIEAASVAWRPLGWQPVAFAEIEPFPCAVLAHHYPEVPNLGDVTKITDEQIAALGPIDLVVGGSPCTDLSVAGKRAGLAGKHSGLFFELIRIFNAARTLCGARFMLWENVPGIYSSNAGLDFGRVVSEMAGCDIPVPADGWGTEGVALGDAGLVEWCVLDAQWFGVPQRRRRCFALLDTGDWWNRPPVLLEPDSLRGDSPPRREAGEEVAGTLASRAQGGGRFGTDFDLGGGLIPEVGMCLNAGAMGRQDAESETLIPVVTHSLTAEGADASEDGTGRGIPIVPIAFDCKASTP
jgi:DNA (cytosine-5)-methyltransferase 1